MPTEYSLYFSSMVLPLQGHLPGKLAGPPVGLRYSSLSTKTRGTQGVFSMCQVGRVGRPAVQWSQSPGRVPQISAITSRGFPSF